MSKERFYTTGVAAFVNLVEHEIYEGKSTNNYSVKLTLDAEEAAKLEAHGVMLSDYKGTPQRKFKSQYNIRLVDIDKKPMSPAAVTYGSTLRVMYELGKPSPVYGVSPYAVAIQVLALNDLDDQEGEF
tara:strand:+ start:1953 stop:2336 length:384 start_codon:yes stop_codon:yes gene_type:complete